jgi:hypothetical protein
MAQKVELFEESPMLGGFALAVRDDWNYKIKRVHITEDEKKAYIAEFGEEILTYNRFFEWWMSYKLANNKV